MSRIFGGQVATAAASAAVTAAPVLARQHAPGTAPLRRRHVVTVCYATDNDRARGNDRR
ncbi:hypothetical protein ABZ678_03625 [Streptomyces hirsutus]|uniref:hypothetical protein n=1 Tax=Streptomyces hirsutus TaxID=35620 RepID=UPI0033C4A185